jgi:tetratricopeptide (TPR) repeat protein
MYTNIVRIKRQEVEEMHEFQARIWEEEVEIPTYPAGAPDKNPMFLEKRVYQGSSGKVYPLSVIDKIHDEKVQRKYKMVFLENKYLLIAVMPELGGRIQRAFDKTNGYDFVYYNRVIKPALVGLAGPWISGGIEFNWPQHHRPTTFSPVDYELHENEDGSKSVFIGEIDRMYGTKVTTAFTLYPDKAYLEIKAQLYNRTPLPQTFLWWANPAVAANDHTKSIFPPDVHAVMDHGKRDVSKFPIATGVYYKTDYSKGVDISRYKNIPVPTSYMAYHSDYDFIGGYDFSKEAGILHIADHNISPGKKQWTWGCGDFGKAWDRNLTDEDGPYIELMTGVYTDNQPDFSWLNPYEEKAFTQYFMPYKQIGEVKNAGINAAVNLELENGKARIAVYTSSVFERLCITLKHKDHLLFETVQRTAPEAAYIASTAVPDHIEPSDCELQVRADDGKLLVSYRPEKEKVLKLPEAARPAAQPEEIKTNEELYLTGLHLEQYRHATYEPELYYLEGLKRDPSDIRVNNAYAKLLLRRGLFKESEAYFREAIRRMTEKNPNPYDGEPFYNLGLSLKYQGRQEEAFKAFYKSTWNASCQDVGYFSLAQIAAGRKDFAEALEFVEKALVRNYHNRKARTLKAALLRRLGRQKALDRLIEESIALDPMDYGCRNELYYSFKVRKLSKEAEEASRELDSLMRHSHHSYIELSKDYAECGLYEEAIDVLERHLELTAHLDDAVANNAHFNDTCIDGIGSVSVYPMVYYYLGNYYLRLAAEEGQVANKEAYENENQNANRKKAEEYFRLAADACSDYCFPNTLEDKIALETALSLNPYDAMAHYYLGNLLYDKKQYQKAAEHWEISCSLNPEFAVTHRNLALAYYNKLNRKEEARQELEKAFLLNPADARILFELDQLYKKQNVCHSERLNLLEKHVHLVEARDDLYVEYVTLLNNIGEYEKALRKMMERKFHPWEGGEGKITSQYVLSHVELAKQLLEGKQYHRAIEHLAAAKVYPHNLGEGKLVGAQENQIDYYLGVAYEGLQDTEAAVKFFEKASKGLDEPAGAMYYNDQPADTIYYQGLALEKQGKQDEARGRFHKLYDYGEKHIFDEMKIDYFAVSLPDFLVFEEDLNKKNAVHCNYLMGLGSLGLGNLEKARVLFREALNADINHQGVRIHYNQCKG